VTKVIVKPESAKNVKILIKSAVENEMKIMRLGIAKTKRKLEELEKKFGMVSEHFYKKYSEGKLGDNPEYIRWAGEYETLRQLQEDYKDLLETDLCS